MFRYNKGMDVPSELQKRWAERDRHHHSPKIATLDISEYDPALPILDSLDEPIESCVQEPVLMEHARSSPIPFIDPLQLHSTQNVGLESISIASYAPAKLSKTGDYPYRTR
jgi:hypothetical protein